MKLSLHEIQYSNIREMKDLTINLCHSEKPRHISLIQMPNGIGKTTTMELIRYCLDGTATDLNAEKILSFRPPGSDASKGLFRLKLSVDGELKIVSIKFDYKKPSITYTTSKASVTGGGESTGLHLGREIEPWLKDKDFVRLFVFDGELAGKLLSSASTSAEEAINSLYLLNSLRDLFSEGGEIDELINQKITGGVQTDQGIASLETKLRNATDCLHELNKRKDEIETQLTGLQNEIGKAENQIDEYRKKNEQLIIKYEELKHQNILLEDDITDDTELLLEKLRFPYNISDNVRNKMKKLAEQMGKLKLPKTQSIEFFNELAECSICVCDRPIGEKEKEAIKRRASEFLTEDSIGEINAIKTAIRELPEREDLDLLIKSIKNNNRKKKLNERNILTLDRKTQDKAKIQELRQKIDGWKIAENNCLEMLNVLKENRKEEQETIGLEWKDNIDLCEKRIKTLQDKLAQATNTVDFKNKALFLKEIIKEIHQESLVRLKMNILHKTNQRIERLLKNKELKISKIGTYLHLQDRMGASEGQKLSIAYAFLSTLFSESPHKLPFIVDTPAAPLDLDRRREVAGTIPDLFDQIVVFITSGERDGFADRFYGATKDCLFCTISKNQGEIEQNNSQSFFKEFQSEEN